ncbi:MAG: hypothetical protein J6B89_03380 [Bacilli bacterium]|nr:hypothetical protein [Bacilli bacterium]
MVKLLEKLINKKFYENKEDIVNKCNVFFAMNVISEEEYSSLILQIEEVYFVAPVEEPIIDEEVTE